MKVLIACEFSGIVREAFKARGHDAWSCDLLPSEIPGNHIQDNVLNHLNDGWDLMIAHPPCTYICRNRARLNNMDWELARIEVEDARRLFMQMLDAEIPKICVENPVPAKKSNLPHYSQIIQPWHFGHDYSKKTCLWLKNLLPLRPTNTVKTSYITTKNGFRYTAGWYKMPRTSIARSRTFKGIAHAMAEQWG